MPDYHGTSDQSDNHLTDSATQIIIGVPTLPAGTYYPVVTLPSAYGSVPPSQPYNEPADIFTSTG